MNDEEFFEYNKYLRKMTKQDPIFATKNCFSISDEEIKKCKDMISEINKTIEQISKTKVIGDRNELNRKKGKLLENLTKVILNSADIFVVRTNIRDHTNEIDLLLTPSDYNKLHESLLPKYLKEDILIECKNYNNKIKVDWVGKFSSLLNTHDTSFGIIFSFKELAGQSEWQSSKGLTKKIYLSEKKAIINIHFEDINDILEKRKNIVELIKDKYDSLRHQVDYSAYILPHPAELKQIID